MNNFLIRFFTHIILGSSSYQQQQQNPRGRSSRYSDREKDRIDRLERERERVHHRERDVMGYDLNNEDLINDRHFNNGGASVRERGVRDEGGGSGSEYPMQRDDRRSVVERDMRDRDPRMDARDRREHYVGSQSNSRHLMNNSYDSDNVDLIRDMEKERYAHRRDEYSYSPQHQRGNRRVLNMNAM